MNKPDLNKPAFQIFPEKADTIKNDLCPMCGKPVTEFRDSISQKEFSISGLCQTCQDHVFG